MRAMFLVDQLRRQQQFYEAGIDPFTISADVIGGMTVLMSRRQMPPDKIRNTAFGAHVAFSRAYEVVGP